MTEFTRMTVEEAVFLDLYKPDNYGNGQKTKHITRVVDCFGNVIGWTVKA